MTVFGNSQSSKRGLAALLGALSLYASGAHGADAGWTDTIRYQGFIGQGLVWTDHNNVLGQSTDGSVDFREIGLNVSARPLANFQLAGQLMSRLAGETDDGKLRVDYALADYTFLTGSRTQAGIRLGKIKNPLGLYNETRDVPFTRPSVLLPQSIYLDRTREATLSATGLQAYADRTIGNGILSFQLTAGKPSAEGLDYAIFGNDAPGSFDSQTSYVARLLYDNQQGLLLGLTYTSAINDYEPGAADPNSPGRLTFRPIILSLQYDTGTWEITSELASRPLKLHGFGVVPDSHTTGQSGYLQGIYRFNERWQALARYDVLYTDRHDRDGRDYAAATLKPAHSRFAKDLTLGVSWTPTTNWMLSTEFHHVDGTAWLAAQENPQPTRQRWNMILAELSFRF